MKIVCNSKNLKGKTLITGFHGLGVTGYIAVKHILETTEAKCVGWIEDNEIPCIITFDDGINLPIRLYEWDKFLFIITEVGIPPELINSFGEAIISFCMSKKLKEVIVIGGLDNNIESEDTMRVVHSSQFKKELNENPLESGLQVVGPLASLLAFGEMRKFPVAALLPYCYKQRPDPRAAAIAIEKLKSLYALDVDTDKLKSDAKDIESKINKMMEQQQHKIDEGGAMFR